MTHVASQTRAAWLIPGAPQTPEVPLILAAPDAATMFLPTTVVMSIARPTRVGNRRAAVAGPIVDRLLEALIARIQHASAAQVVPTVIRVHGVLSGVAVDVLVEAQVESHENEEKKQEDSGDMPDHVCGV